MTWLGPTTPAYALCPAVDLHKGFDGLYGLPTQTLGCDVLRGDLFLFVGRDCLRAKRLYFDGTGLCLLHKRLSQGRFAAPCRDAQPTLPTIEERHELPPSEQTCGICNGAMEAMGQQTEDSEEITVVKRQLVIVVHKRQKYRCRCNASVQTAPGPLKLIPGGRYSLAFAVEVAIAKYAYHVLAEPASERGQTGWRVATGRGEWSPNIG